MAEKQLGRRAARHMRPLDLALRYMEIFYSGDNLGELSQILTDDLTFSGPLYEFSSAEGYIESLKSDPPKDCSYEIISSFENESSACLVYEFSKPGVSTTMAQTFEVAGDKINRILLVFDTSALHGLEAGQGQKRRMKAD